MSSAAPSLGVPCSFPRLPLLLGPLFVVVVGPGTPSNAYGFPETDGDVALAVADADCLSLFFLLRFPAGENTYMYESASAVREDAGSAEGSTTDGAEKLNSKLWSLGGAGVFWRAGRPGGGRVGETNKL